MSIIVWNRIGPARCADCGKKIRVGQIVDVVKGVGWAHLECPTNDPMSVAFEIMRRWTQHDDVPIGELLQAAKSIINNYESTTEGTT